MFVLRPIREEDLPGLMALARSIDGSLTTLPPNAEFLEERIQSSRRAFDAKPRKAGGEIYLFVLENTATGEIVGTSGIAARVGGFEPWYSYEIREENYFHRPLKIEKKMSVLHLKAEHRGPSELCSLFLRADHRRGGLGRLLSLGRLLFMGAEPQRFTDTVIAEMRGYVDQTGRSPFWEAVGRHFFDFDFYSADALSGLGEKAFIADLMPRHPLYIPLLGADVQAVVGRVHHDTEAALALLVAEGFARTNEVDIFDAGPLIRAEVAQLRTLRLARVKTIAGIDAGPPPAKAPLLLLSNGQVNFRATLAAPWNHDEESVSLDSPTAAVLRVKAGDSLWISPPR